MSAGGVQGKGGKNESRHIRLDLDPEVLRGTTKTDLLLIVVREAYASFERAWADPGWRAPFEENE